MSAIMSAIILAAVSGAINIPSSIDVDQAAYGQSSEVPPLTDDSLRVELVSATGLAAPTGMTFLDSRGTIMILEKNSGNAFLLENGKVSSSPFFHSPVANGQEQGLLSVTSVNEAELMNVPAQNADTNKDYVFMYLTEADGQGHPIGNNVYRFVWDPQQKVLRDKQLILKLPADPGPSHNGGKLIVDRHGYLFTVIGDINRVSSILQNTKEAATPDDTSVIIRTNLDGTAAADNPFAGYGREVLSKYYAYGIRNSFGLSIDPLTGILWDTENGPDFDDEINIVHPGFNSGWSKIMGPVKGSDHTTADLFLLQGARYYDPLFNWRTPIGVTDIEFLNSQALGEKYAYNIFIGDFNGGSLYFFKLNDQRDGLVLDEHEELKDKMADDFSESDLIKLGDFDDGISDLETGPDGYLYVLAMNGDVYRIIPKPSCDILLADPNNQSPIADAGPDSSQESGTTIELDGTDSWDPNGRIVSYSWAQKSGPAIEIEDSNSEYTTFMVPDVGETEEITIELLVTDDNCAQDSDDIVITIGPRQ